MKDDRSQVFFLLGVSTYQDYLATPLWKGIRELVLKHSRSTCRLCRGHANQVHHRSYDRATLLGLTLETLVSLCERCHHAIEFDGDRKRSPEEAEAKIDAYINPKVPDCSQLSNLERLLKGMMTLEDRRECDLLTILTVRLDLIPFVTSAISPEEIGNPLLRDLLEHIVRLSIEHEALDYATLLASTAETGMRVLVEFLDEQTRVYEMERKIREGGVDPSDGCSRFLRRALDEFVWRRDRQSHKDRVALPLSLVGDGTPTPEELLRQAQQFHQRRANRAGVVPE